MTLDFVRLAPRISELLEFLHHDSLVRNQRLREGERLMESVSNERLEDALGIAVNANWLLARPEEPLDTHRAVPPLTIPYAALATDGSSIDVDRHAPAACYVLNIGHAWLDYGFADVDLGGDPEIEFAEAHLLSGDNQNASKESAMTGNLLDAYRTAREMLRLQALAERHNSSSVVVALLDGQFVLWGLKETELSSQAREAIYEHGVIHALDGLRSLSEGSRLTLGSYVSRPAGREVTNTLRILACPRPGGANCRDCPRRPDGARPCDDVAGGTDADLFARVLAEGERSALFSRFSLISDLSHADSRYTAAGHGLRFFYLRIPGGEIARIETPEWVTATPSAVDLLQAAVLDQCERGGGYPLVLQEAHEQAVIDTSARRTFSLLLERQMDERGHWAAPSGKSWSKRRRTI
jgi:hypothetical protein